MWVKSLSTNSINSFRKETDKNKRMLEQSLIIQTPNSLPSYPTYRKLPPISTANKMLPVSSRVRSTGYPENLSLAGVLKIQCVSGSLFRSGD